MAQQSLAGREGKTGGDTVVAVDIIAVLNTELQMIVAHLYLSLEECLRAVVGVYVGIVDDCAEEIAEVDTCAEPLDRTYRIAGKQPVETTLARTGLATVADAVGKRVSHRREGHKTEGHTHVLGHRKLHGDVIEATSELLLVVARSLCVGLAAPELRHRYAHIEKECDGVDGGIARGIHHIDLTA